MLSPPSFAIEYYVKYSVFRANATTVNKTGEDSKSTPLDLSNSLHPPQLGMLSRATISS